MRTVSWYHGAESNTILSDDRIAYASCYVDHNGKYASLTTVHGVADALTAEQEMKYQASAVAYFQAHN